MISVVIPVFNEADSLELLHDELCELKAQMEVIFVDDGSTDRSWQIIKEIAAKPGSNAIGIRLRRNFGKAAALSAGFGSAVGRFIVTLDADLQDDPKEIPSLLSMLESGLDVVSGWKKVRHDPWHKTMPSRIFNSMVSRLTGVRLHDHNCGMKAYNAEVIREVDLYGELHRFIPVLAAARGFRVGEVVIQHRPRRFGRSKYGVRRFLKGFLDLLTVKFLTGFGQRPQHLLGGIGLFSFLTGSLALAFLTATWIVNYFQPGRFLPLHERPLLIYAVAALLLGAQMMSMGLLAELLTAYAGRATDRFSIRETISRDNRANLPSA